MTAIMPMPDQRGLNIDPGSMYQAPPAGGNPATSDPAFYNWLIQSQGMDPGQLAGGSVPGIDNLYNEYETNVASGGISPGAYRGGNPGTTLGNESAGSGASYSNPGENVLTGTMIQPSGTSGPMSGSSAPGGGVPTLQTALFGNPAEARSRCRSRCSDRSRKSRPRSRSLHLSTQPLLARLDTADGPGRVRRHGARHDEPVREGNPASLDPTFPGAAGPAESATRCARHFQFVRSARSGDATSGHAKRNARGGLCAGHRAAAGRSAFRRFLTERRLAWRERQQLDGLQCLRAKPACKSVGAASGAISFNATADYQATAGNAATQLRYRAGRSVAVQSVRAGAARLRQSVRRAGLRRVAQLVLADRVEHSRRGRNVGGQCRVECAAELQRVWAVERDLEHLRGARQRREQEHRKHDHQQRRRERRQPG